MPFSCRAWFLGVLLSASGFCVGGSTNRFEGEVQALEARALRNPPPTGAVMLYGSSSFRLWSDAAARFPRCALVNHGFGGAHLSDLNEFFERLVVPAAPRLLLIYGGDNDLAAGKSPQRVLADFQELVQRVRTHLPGTRVGFVAIKPSPSRIAWLGVQNEANHLVRRYARGMRRVDFLDVVRPLMREDATPDPGCYLKDQLHLNGAGYDRWMEVLGPYVERWRPRQTRTSSSKLEERAGWES